MGWIPRTQQSRNSIKSRLGLRGWGIPIRWWKEYSTVLFYLTKEIRWKRLTINGVLRTILKIFHQKLKWKVNHKISLQIRGISTLKILRLIFGTMSLMISFKKAIVKRFRIIFKIFLQQTTSHIKWINKKNVMKINSQYSISNQQITIHKFSKIFFNHLMPNKLTNKKK